MKYLLDTCTIVWFFTNNEKKMPKNIFHIIENAENEIFISIISLWELSIKWNLGKIDLPFGINHELKKELEKQAIDIINIDFEDIIEHSGLPLVHRDPFDRLLISQSRVRGLSVITNDHLWNNPLYKIKVVWD